METELGRKQIKMILLFAVFYVFCLYDNRMGITYPIFMAGFLSLYAWFVKKEGGVFKKDSWFYFVSIELLAVSTFLTDNLFFVQFNRIGSWLLTGILVLHNSYEDEGWNFAKYALSLLKFALGIFGNLFSIFKVRHECRRKEAEAEHAQRKESKAVYIWIGILIGLALLCLILPLLVSADQVFSNFLGKILYLFFSKVAVPDQLVFLLLMFIWGVLFFFGLFYTIRQKKLDPVQKDYRTLEPLTAITALGLVGIFYLIFSVIQISYLFTGGLTLPAGYSYSSFARQGFFQLLFVCFLNLVIVLACLGLFREHKGLKILLTFLSGCTYIMIFSSAVRIYLYIEAYQLTRLRVLVVAALLVLAILLTAVIRSIYKTGFPLFRFTTVVVTVVYLGLSLSHMDAWIAAYNISRVGLDITDENPYIQTLSADAAGVYLKALENGAERTEMADDLILGYFQRVRYVSVNNEGFRKFNLSRYLGGKAAAQYLETVPDAYEIREVTQ